MTVVARDGIEVVPTSSLFITLPVAQRLDVVSPSSPFTPYCLPFHSSTKITLLFQIVDCNQDPEYDYAIHVSIPVQFIPVGANLVNLSTYAILCMERRILR